MKTKLSKQEAQEKINEFFQREHFTSDEVRKVKRIAMKSNIKLGKYRRRFCKRCYSKLKGKTRVGKMWKSVDCERCGFKNRFRLI